MVNQIFKHYQKGVSLYLALLVMTILLSIGLTISTILLGQIKMIRGMGDSVIAFYAADTGIEETLMTRANIPPSSPCTQDLPCVLDNGSSYYIVVTPKGGSCQAANYCIESVGAYRGIKRAIEVEY